MRITDSLTKDVVSLEISSLKKRFEELFGSLKSTNLVVTPASLVLLGDHTHYNDGQLLSVALNKYSGVLLRKRKDKKIIIADSISDEILEFKLGDKPLPPNVNYKYIIGLLYAISELSRINFGFECVISNPIPDCIGLGKVASIQVSFAFAIKKTFGINLNMNEILSIIRNNELQILGKIANYAQIYTAKIQKENKLFFIDLRTFVYKSVPIKKDEFDLVIFNTGEKVIEPTKICNERIEECEVGVKGLRLYIWGIKNLRDVELDFLLKHVHMLPKRIFNRILFNVNERIRVEKAINAIKKHSYMEFGKYITDSHWNMSSEYELSCEKCDFLVTAASKTDCSLGSKMISCSSYRSTFNIVKKGCSQNFIKTISGEYYKKYGEELISYTFHLSEKVNKKKFNTLSEQ